MKKNIIAIIASVIFYILAVFIYNYIEYKSYKKDQISIIDEKLKVAAHSVYGLLGEDFFKKAINKDSISLDEDWKNIHKLTYYNNHANLAFIYSSIKKDNKVYLTSSSASQEELDNKSEVHYYYHFDSAGKALVNAFENNKIVYENHADEWGSFRAVHIPITMKDSPTIVVSAEITLDEYNKTLAEIKNKYLLDALFYLIITIPIFILVYRTLKKNMLETR